MLTGVGDLFDARHAPLAGRRDHLEVRRQRPDRNIESDLVVALAGAAVRDGRRAFLPRRLNHQSGDERPAKRGGDGIDALVESVGLEGGKDELADELVADIGDVRADKHRTQARAAGSHQGCRRCQDSPSA